MNDEDKMLEEFNDRTHSKRGPFNIEYFYTVQESINDEYINELKTFYEFGYYSIDLLCKSNKKIWGICKSCGNERRINYYDYTSGQKRCRPCAKKGTTHSEKTKRQMSENHPDVSGKNNPMYGIRRYGKDSPHYDTPHTEESKQKISDSNKGKIHSEESRQKMSATKQGIPYEEWESFATNSPYCPKFNEAIKEYIRNKYDRRCFLCNKPEEENITSTGKHQRLSVHHVDMNKNQGCDEHKWKLVPLCMKCHTTKIAFVMWQYIEYILENE